jgi:hypothetical protein
MGDTPEQEHIKNLVKEATNEQITNRFQGIGIDDSSFDKRQQTQANFSFVNEMRPLRQKLLDAIAFMDTELAERKSSKSNTKRTMRDILSSLTAQVLFGVLAFGAGLLYEMLRVFSK